MVAGEVAAAVLLLCGAGLLLRTLLALEDFDPGIARRRSLLTLDFSVPLPNPGRRSGPYRDGDGRVRVSTTKPGAESAHCRACGASDGRARCRWRGRVGPHAISDRRRSASPRGDRPIADLLGGGQLRATFDARYSAAISGRALHGARYRRRHARLPCQRGVRAPLPRGRNPIGVRVGVRGMNAGSQSAGVGRSSVLSRRSDSGRTARRTTGHRSMCHSHSIPATDRRRLSFNRQTARSWRFWRRDPRGRRANRQRATGGSVRTLDEIGEHATSAPHDSEPCSSATSRRSRLSSRWSASSASDRYSVRAAHA